jgi:DNA polymerase-4
MGGRRARELCPDAIVVPPRYDAYVEASRAVFDVFEETAPVVEPLSIDEAFLDVRGMERIAGEPDLIAARLRREVRRHVGLPITVGVACTKFLAKVASGAAKPDGLLVVPPGGELAFLHPLPVEALWGVGPATSAKLRAQGITTVAEAGRVPERHLVELVGRAAGRKLHALAHNRDPRPVRRGPGRRSFGSQSALGRRPHPAEEIDTVLLALVDRVTRRMRAKHRAGRTVTLRLRFGDFSRATRSRTLREPTAETGRVLDAGRALLREARPTIERRGLTLVGITVSNLTTSHLQLRLPLGRRNGGAVDAAADEVRDRFGATALVRAALVGRDRMLATWLQPGDGG